MIILVLLHNEDNSTDNFIVYAVLDNQSDACFLFDFVLDKLDTQGEEVQIHLSTILAENTITCKRMSGLVINGIGASNIDIKLQKTHSRDTIPAKHTQIPKSYFVHKWDHLR